MIIVNIFFPPKCVRRDCGVPAAQRPAQSVRTEACVTNTMGRVSVLRASWVKSAKTVSISRLSVWFP